VWKVSVELPPGVHHYRFLVGGEWRDDPECIVRVPNPFGGQNAVRQVGRTLRQTERQQNDAQAGWVLVACLLVGGGSTFGGSAGAGASVE